MPKKIILVRHGETDFNKEKIIQGQLDTFLNNEGIKQAEEIGQNLRNENIDVIFSSDLKRTYQTALIVSKKIKKLVIKTKFLRERYFGKLQGLKIKEIKADIFRYGEEGFWNGSWLDKIFEIETSEQIKKRLTHFFILLKKHKNQTVLLVTHGGTIREILNFLNFDKNFVRNLSIPNTSCLALKRGNNGYELA